MVEIIKQGKETEKKWQNIRDKYFTLKDILIYIILGSAVFSLGLMNWATFTFDWDKLSWSFVAHSLTQVVAYGAIIGSFTSKQLDKKKQRDKHYNKLVDYNFKVLEFYRPDKLKEYINLVNLDAKRTAYLDKYRTLLNQHEEKYGKEDNIFECDRSWKRYLIEKKENPEMTPPNDYCKNKEYLMQKINNANEDFETDNVTFEKLLIEDLTSGVLASDKHRIPRGTEAKDAFQGIMRNMTLMVAGSLLSAGILLNLNDGGIEAWAKTLFTIFLSFFSAFKGLWNGERVFDNTTLLKESFRRHHLHSYAVYEAKEHNHIVLSENDERG